jgi:hypothetical protein
VGAATDGIQGSAGDAALGDELSGGADDPLARLAPLRGRRPAVGHRFDLTWLDYSVHCLLRCPDEWTLWSNHSHDRKGDAR